MKKFLHVGCGKKHKDATTSGFNRPDWQEVRFDIEAKVAPDILGDMLDMASVADGSFDGLFSSHNIEHVYAYQVQTVLSEFRRVLKPEGFAVVTCPDIQPVCEAIAAGNILEPMYSSPSGPISPLDILYGHGPSIEVGYESMAHKTGFTNELLARSLLAAGFAKVITRRRPHPKYDLWAVAFASARDQDDMNRIAAEHLPPMPK